MENIEECRYWSQHMLLNIKANPKRIFSIEYLADLQTQLQEKRVVCEKVVECSNLIDRVLIKPSVDECIENFKTICEIVKEKLRKTINNKKPGPNETNISTINKGRIVTPAPTISFIREDNQLPSHIIMSSVSFRDIEEALEKFDGVATRVSTWIQQFEAVAVSCEFSQVQKYLFCRRLLTGAARLAVEAEADLSNYESLKEFLIAEFGVEVRSFEVHAELAAARKRGNETAVEFAYRIKKVAGLGKIDETSTNDYIINGIGASRSEKAGMFEAKTFKDLKVKLIAYDRANIQNPNNDGQKSRYEENNKNYNNNLRVKQERPRFTAAYRPYEKSPPSQPRLYNNKNCFGCGKEGHFVKDCRRYITKCFRCGENGHIAPACPVKKSQQVSQVETNAQ